MTQLRIDGWIHHLARHAVACFLTRGDLWQHWEEGAKVKFSLVYEKCINLNILHSKVFDLYLLDADWALNNANWQWLSCSNFFYQYFRCYSPVAFGKKTDKDGNYIRKWIPALKKMPTKYIYEPWLAPLQVQRDCGCVIGVDYPHPLVDHNAASKENMAKMKSAYESSHDVTANPDLIRDSSATSTPTAFAPKRSNENVKDIKSSKKPKVSEVDASIASAPDIRHHFQVGIKKFKK